MPTKKASRLDSGTTAPTIRPIDPRAIRIEPITAVLRNPQRGTTLAAINTLIDQEANSGMIDRPASVAEPPRTPCTNKGT